MLQSHCRMRNVPSHVPRDGRDGKTIDLHCGIYGCANRQEISGPRERALETWTARGLALGAKGLGRCKTPLTVDDAERRWPARWSVGVVASAHTSQTGLGRMLGRVRGRNDLEYGPNWATRRFSRTKSHHSAGELRSGAASLFCCAVSRPSPMQPGVSPPGS